MREYLDEDDLSAYMRMLRVADDRIFLVVEGPSDARMLNQQIDDSDCTTIPGYGKRSVLAAFERMSSLEQHDCLGLIDRDFGDMLYDNESDVRSIPTNVFITDLYDLESDLLLRVGLLDAYINAAKRNEDLSGLLRANRGQPLTEIVLRNTAIVGLLRWCSIAHGFNLRLSDFPMNAIIKWPAQLALSEVIDIAIHRSKRDDVVRDKLLSVIPSDLPIDEQRICSGHDVIRFLAASSKWWAGRKVGKAEIETFISGPIRCDRLRFLTWFCQIEAWANAKSRQVWNC